MYPEKNRICPALSLLSYQMKVYAIDMHGQMKDETLLTKNSSVQCIKRTDWRSKLLPGGGILLDFAFRVAEVISI